MAKIRNTLLVTWQEWRGLGELGFSGGEKLRGRLREDIERALLIAEILDGKRPDLLAPYWMYRDRNVRRWAEMIDAYPLEAEIARRAFPRMAMMYLGDCASDRGGTHFSETLVREVLDAFWNHSWPLQRLALAFWRLHEELRGVDVASAGDVIPSNERIEQMLLVVLNAEKLLVFLQGIQGVYPELARVVRAQLNNVMCRLGVSGGGALAFR